jgi:mannose/fructose-specific phosphotransferase system component IIA
MVELLFQDKVLQLIREQPKLINAYARRAYVNEFERCVILNQFPHSQENKREEMECRLQDPERLLFLVDLFAGAVYVL